MDSVQVRFGFGLDLVWPHELGLDLVWIRFGWVGSVWIPFGLDLVWRDSVWIPFDSIRFGLDLVWIWFCAIRLDSIRLRFHSVVGDSIPFGFGSFLNCTWRSTTTRSRPWRPEIGERAPPYGMGLLLLLLLLAVFDAALV